MDMHACRDSGQIRAYGYEPKTETFRVQFVNGRTAEYKRVPYAVFMAFLHAESKGSFLHRDIKGKYDFEYV